MGGTFTPLRAHCCTRVLGTKEGELRHGYLPSATYLNLVNAEFLVLAFLFFSCCQGGEAFYLAVAQILTLLIVQALCCPFYCCWCRFYTTDRVYAGQIFAVGVGVMLPILLLLVPLLRDG